ncbi:hypothetical protein C8J57DRAFT_1252566 [Mycena rebaudengoi]|nr:hypothetical protein C8J57DRAFT_1252566 [Mycena rebaudengoi]
MPKKGLQHSESVEKVSSRETTPGNIIQPGAESLQTGDTEFLAVNPEETTQATEWDFALGEELPDTECMEFQEELGDEEDVELVHESAFDAFTKFLYDAQAAARKLEQQQNGGKRKRGSYTGKSKTTQWREKKAKERLTGLGYHNLKDLFAAQAVKKSRLNSKSDDGGESNREDGTVSEPELSEPELSEPEIIASEPEMTEPELSEPEIMASDPEMTEPELSEPETIASEPQMTEPEVLEPEIDASEEESSETDFDSEPEPELENCMNPTQRNT